MFTPNQITTREGDHLYFRDWGEGRPVLFMAGWAMTSGLWLVCLSHANGPPGLNPRSLPSSARGVNPDSLGSRPSGSPEPPDRRSNDSTSTAPP